MGGQVYGPIIAKITCHFHKKTKIQMTKSFNSTLRPDTYSWIHWVIFALAQIVFLDHTSVQLATTQFKIFSY